VSKKIILKNCPPELADREGQRHILPDGSKSYLGISSMGPGRWRVCAFYGTGTYILYKLGEVYEVYEPRTEEGKHA